MTELFLENLKRHFYQNLEGANPLQRMIRTKAWDRFLEKGLPSKKLPGYQYFPLSQLYSETFERSVSATLDPDTWETLILPECKRSVVIFVNGEYRPDLSDLSALPSGVVVRSLHEALNAYGTFLQTRFSHIFQHEVDPFALLNIALIQRGLFIYVPPKVVVKEPIQCLHLMANERPMLFSPRIHLFLGAHSQMHWMHRTHRLHDCEYLSNFVVDVALEEGASLKQLGMNRPSAHGWHLDALRITQKRDSRFCGMICTQGAKAMRHDFQVSLLGENASCDLQGIAALHDHRQSHVHVLMEHKAPHTRSNQHFKNILFDTTRSSFEGKIFVHPIAQKTESYQLNNNLILDPGAMANTKPNLEIFADDVKASHGATIAQLNDAHLHYLCSRGIAPAEAKRLLITSFAQGLFTDLPPPWQRELAAVKLA